jgi:hypothetical protein
VNIYERHAGDGPHLRAHRPVVGRNDVVVLVHMVALWIHDLTQAVQRRQGLVKVLVVASRARELLGLFYERLVLRHRGVEAANVTLRDHRLDFSAAEHLLQSPDDVDLEFVGILQDLGIEQDLVGLAEAEVEFVLIEQLFVGLVDVSNET